MDYNILLNLLDLIINLDEHLISLINTYGMFVYAIIFLIIFCETGLVVTPFLPGDSLIFVLGALGASGQINLLAICLVLMTAAILGNMTNYQIGRFIGPKYLRKNPDGFLRRNIFSAPTLSLKDMAAKPLSSLVLCPSSELLPRLSRNRAYGILPIYDFQFARLRCLGIVVSGRRLFIRQCSRRREQLYFGNLRDHFYFAHPGYGYGLAPEEN